MEYRIYVKNIPMTSTAQLLDMDLTIVPDIYVPNVDEEGNYIDRIPIIRNGLYCPCGSRKDKTYENAGKFASHTKTKCHQKWLLLLNQNKANYYAESIKQREVVESQQKIILDLKIENQIQKATIHYLTEQLKDTTNGGYENLMDIN